MSSRKDSLKNCISLLKLLRYRRPRKGERVIVFYAENLWERGGVESRLLEYARELRLRGILPVFVARRFKHEGYRNEICIRARYDAGNFTECLLAIARYFRADALEYQLTWTGSLRRFDIDRIKGKIRTGLVIHSNISGLDYDALNKFDYRIVMKGTLSNINYAAFCDYAVIENAISMPECPAWGYNGQQKALVFSRFSSDKMATLLNVSAFLKKKGIPFEIVGMVQDEDAKNLLIEKAGLHPSQIKEMNVGGPEYMKKHAGEYLFVAGVGIVLLEAASLGFPCLIASELRPEGCTFLTRESLAEHIYPNFTYPVATEEGEANIVGEIDVDKIEDYILEDIIRDQYSMSSRIVEYLDVVFPKQQA